MERIMMSKKEMVKVLINQVHGARIKQIANKEEVPPMDVYNRMIDAFRGVLEEKSSIELDKLIRESKAIESWI